MNTLTMQAIRDRYPTPIVYRTDLTHEEIHHTCYCTGGAILLAGNFGRSYSDTPRFPGFEDLRHVLLELNPELEVDDADYYATCIIDFNDAAAFEDAWNMVDCALTYRRQ